MASYKDMKMQYAICNPIKCNFERYKQSPNKDYRFESLDELIGIKDADLIASTFLIEARNIPKEVIDSGVKTYKRHKGEIMLAEILQMRN